MRRWSNNLPRRTFAKCRWQLVCQRRPIRRGFTVRDLAVTLACLLIAAGMLAPLTGATRDLSKTQVCANHLRQMYAGLTAYVNQYNCYPPNAPYPTYMASETINGISTNGWDPNIGFIMTHGLGLTPPRTDTATGHFIWYGTPYADLPDVCKCPSMPPSLLDAANPELGTSPLESTLYQYALAYMTSGTCRAATTVVRPRQGTSPGIGGRNPAIPDPTSGDTTAHQVDNSQRGNPYVWVDRHDPAAPPESNAPGGEYGCWVQAINPAEVQAPGRVFYLADSCDYRAVPGGWPAAGTNNGWGGAYGNRIFTSARHFGYGNTLYLDGRVTRDGQMHQPQWNMDYASTGQPTSTQWRVAAFDTEIKLARIVSQVRTMPVLMVRGWEYFFDATGVKAQ